MFLDVPGGPQRGQSDISGGTDGGATVLSRPGESPRTTSATDELRLGDEVAKSLYLFYRIY